MNKYILNNKGISLLEVLIVLTIIGITGAIIVPSTGIVQRNRLKNIASQITMDVKKVRFFAQTHEDSNGYKIEFSDKKYTLHGKGLGDTEPITDGIVKFTPIAIKSDGSEHPVKKISFDKRGRMFIPKGTETEENINLKEIKIMLETDQYKKELRVNPLTARTDIGDTIKK
ncbi:MAG: prepilin-type N-terminal cleavage/methylation domain-containing protein [Epulopiscium sp.]|nr:prepilin-type N-terminal cleavage/methylation domain-containing protein [Candidatus Epulonipiscium sp.]